MKAWVLIIWFSSSYQIAVNDIASESACSKLGDAIGDQTDLRFKPKYVCTSYDKAEAAPASAVTAKALEPPRRKTWRRRRRR